MASSVALIAALVVALPPLQVTGMGAGDISTVQKFWSLAVAREAGCGVRPRLRLTPSQEGAFARCAGAPQCLAAKGGVVSANKVLAGTLDVRAGRFSVLLMLVDVPGQSVQTITSRETDKPERLFAALRSAAAEVCGGLAASGETAAAPPPPEAVAAAPMPVIRRMESSPPPPREAPVEAPLQAPLQAAAPPPESSPRPLPPPLPPPQAPRVGDGAFDDLPPIPSPE